MVKQTFAQFSIYSIPLLLFGVIMSNVFLLSHGANALTLDGISKASISKYLPFKHTLFKSIVIDDSTTDASNSITQNATNTQAIKATPVTTFIAFVVSIAIVSGLFVFVAYVLKGREMKISDIIRDGSGFPSLARFQFLMWTFILMFAVLSVYFIRLFMGTPQLPDDIPANLLILTGISIAVPFVSNPISSIKYGSRKPTKGTIKDDDRRRLATMLMENEKPTVSRFQMFAWTIISIIIYLGFFFSKTTFLLNDVNGLTVPDIPFIFVTLMGLSQAAYIGNKSTISKTVTVLQVIPNKGAAGIDVIIIGTNFGTKEGGSVLFEDGLKDAVGSQVVVQPNDIKEWQENKIHITVPSQGLSAGASYYIRVISGGIISYKGGGQVDEARFTLE